MGCRNFLTASMLATLFVFFAPSGFPPDVAFGPMPEVTRMRLEGALANNSMLDDEARRVTNRRADHGLFKA